MSGQGPRSTSPDDMDVNSLDTANQTQSAAAQTSSANLLGTANRRRTPSPREMEAAEALASLAPARQARYAFGQSSQLPTSSNELRGLGEGFGARTDRIDPTAQNNQSEARLSAQTSHAAGQDPQEPTFTSEPRALGEGVPGRSDRIDPTTIAKENREPAVPASRRHNPMDLLENLTLNRRVVGQSGSRLRDGGSSDNVQSHASTSRPGNGSGSNTRRARPDSPELGLALDNDSEDSIIARDSDDDRTRSQRDTPRAFEDAEEQTSLRPDADTHSTDAESARAITHMINFLNNTQDDKEVSTESVLAINPFTADMVMWSLKAQGYRTGRDGAKIIEMIIDDPSITSSPDVAVANPPSSTKPGDTSTAYDLTDIGDRNAPNPYHPTRQWPKDKETFFQDVDGKWMIKWEFPLCNGSSHVQVDPLPDWDDSKEPLSQTGKGTSRGEMAPEFNPIPTYHNRDGGSWTADANNLGQYKRTYTNPKGVQKKRMSDVARPVFVIRKFDQNNGRYLSQFVDAINQDELETKIRTFDINSKADVADMNRWLRQVHDRHDVAYKKRETREGWRDYEYKALRSHFNDILQRKGLASAFVSPDWDGALEKVNQTRLEKDSAAALRNLKSVEKAAGNDRYAPDLPNLGITEWRSLGHQLLQFQDQHPGATIADHLLKPHDAMTLDDVPDKKTDPKKSSKGKTEDTAEDDDAQQDGAGENPQDTEPKLKLVLKGDKIELMDRFDGALLKKFFGAQVAADEQDEAEEPAAAPPNKRKRGADDENEDGTTEGDDSGERSPKRAK